MLPAANLLKLPNDTPYDLLRNDWDMRAGFLQKRRITCMLMDDAGKYVNPYTIILPTMNLPISEIVLTPTPASPATDPSSAECYRGGTVALQRHLYRRQHGRPAYGDHQLGRRRGQ